jgi:hypothetical protein
MMTTDHGNDKWMAMAKVMVLTVPKNVIFLNGPKIISE